MMMYDCRSSVTRMSGDQKQSVTLKTKERGDSSIIHNKTPESDQEDKALLKSSSSSGSEAEDEDADAVSSESETGNCDCVF